MSPRGAFTCSVESKPNSRMTKTKMIAVMLIAFFNHRQKIAAARRPSRTPSNGLETANQNETFQFELMAIEFVFTLLSQAFKSRHFTKREISFGESEHSSDDLRDAELFSANHPCPEVRRDQANQRAEQCESNSDVRK